MVRNMDIIYQEVRENALEVNKRAKSEDSLRYALTECATALLWLADVARKEGLLALEEAAESERVAGLILGSELAHMMALVVDGTDPKEVERISLKGYFSRGYEKLEGFVYLLYMDTVLEIQAGENPFVIYENIRSFMPDEVITELDRLQEEGRKSKIRTSEEEWERLFTGEMAAESDTKDYYIMKLVDHCFICMNCEGISRVLKDIETGDLALVMKGLSGNAIRNIHSNLAAGLAANLLEDMVSMGPVRLCDVAEAADRIFKIMLKLEKHGEISLPDNLANIFAMV